MLLLFPYCTRPVFHFPLESHPLQAGAGPGPGLGDTPSALSDTRGGPGPAGLRARRLGSIQVSLVDNTHVATTCSWKPDALLRISFQEPMSHFNGKNESVLEAPPFTRTKSDGVDGRGDGSLQDLNARARRLIALRDRFPGGDQEHVQAASWESYLLRKRDRGAIVSASVVRRLGRLTALGVIAHCVLTASTRSLEHSVVPHFCQWGHAWARLVFQVSRDPPSAGGPG